MELTGKDEERFWKKVKRGNGCWEWCAARDPTGYGRFKLNGKAELAHRVSYTLTRGEIPHGYLVCHHCDNPRCVRPDHLFSGTYSDNMMDAGKKGRLEHVGHQSFGEKNGSSKLTKEKVADIREMYATGNFSYRALGKIYKAGYRTIGHIVNYDIWK